MNQPDIQWVLAEGSHPALLASRADGRGRAFIWGHTLMGSMAQEDTMGVFGWQGCVDIARIIRYDARGHGRSESAGAAVDYAWPGLARDMWQVADCHAGNRAKVILGGASMGCATALHAACQHPDRVRGLVLVLPPTAYADRKKTARVYELSASLVALTRGLPLKLLRWLPLAPGADLRTRTDRASGRLLADASPSGISNPLRGAALSDLPPPERLARLTMPALVLAWPDDAVHPLANAIALANTLPHAELQVSGSAQDPERWPHTVRRFLMSLNQADQDWTNVPLD